MTMTTTTDASSAVLTFSQRALLVDLLHRTADRLDAESTRLDGELQAQFPAEEELEGDREAEYDRLNAAAQSASDDAEAAYTLARLFEEARFVTLQPDTDSDPMSVVARALVAAWVAGGDVGAVMVEAAAEAQTVVFRATEEQLTSNRPGSWEAALLDQALDASGWRHRAG